MRYSARSILALDVSPFGRSLSLIPATRALRASFPQAYLGVAAHIGTCEVLQAQRLVDMAIPLGVVKLPATGPDAIKRGWTIMRQARGYSFELILDFSPRLETQLISRIVLGVPVLSPGRLPGAIGRLFEFGGVRPGGSSALTDYSSVLRQLNVEIQDERIEVLTPSEEDEMFEKRLYSSGSRGGEMVDLIYAANPESARGWPVAAFGEIATRLANNFSARIVIADEPYDNALTRRLGGWLPSGAIKLVQPRASEVFAAIARATVVITDEAVIAQIASELSTPAIEIRDSLTTMRSSPSHRIVTGSSRGRVSVQEVFDVACEMIQENRSRSLFQRS